MNVQILLKHGSRHSEDIIGLPTTAGGHGIDTPADYIVILAHGFIVPDKLLDIGSRSPQAVSIFCPIPLKILPSSSIWRTRPMGDESIHTEFCEDQR